MGAVIGISTNFLTVDKGKFLGMERIYVNRDYVDAVLKAGGTPLLLPPVEDAEAIRRYTELCDGFILSGGGDINPILFGALPHPRLEEVHTSLDRSQWALTEAILNTSKPLLAICRGVQLLNVVLGGTLWQDMGEVPHPTHLHSQIAPRADKFHPVDIVKDSLACRLWGERMDVNSFHHQAIKEPGDRLRVVATAPDGIIEAVELTDRPFGLGVQWHPEMMLTATDEMLPLFRRLVTSCAGAGC